MLHNISHLRNFWKLLEISLRKLERVPYFFGKNISYAFFILIPLMQKFYNKLNPYFKTVQFVLQENLYVTLY